MSDDWDWETKQKLATIEHWKQRAEAAEARISKAWEFYCGGMNPESIFGILLSEEIKELNEVKD